jgi:hypothetical protein
MAVAWAGVRALRPQAQVAPRAIGDAKAASAISSARQPAATAAPSTLVEATGQAPPDCLRTAYQLARPLSECVRDPANRDCGVRFAFTRACKAVDVLPWGKLDDTIRACLATKTSTTARPKVWTSVWFLDYPLGDPAFIAPVDGVGERSWLRRGLPKAPPEMSGLASVRFGPRAPVERLDASVTFGARRYRLRIGGGELEEPYLPGTVALECDGRTQVLVRDVANVRVRWAGDVDGDGRLDLLIQSTMTSFAQRFDLFLSGGADGRLVRLAASDADEGD